MSTILIDGIDVLKKYNMVLESADERYSSSSKTLYETNYDGLDGVTRLGYKYNKKTFSLIFLMFGENARNLRNKANEFTAFLMQSVDREMTMEFTDTGRWAKIRISEAPFTMEGTGATFAQKVLRLNYTCDILNPFIEGQEWGIDGAISQGYGKINSEVRRQLSPYIQEDFEIDTVTLVNLLGAYGNFEPDSNSEYFFNNTLNNAIKFWGKGTNPNFNIVEGNGFIIIDIPTANGDCSGVNEYDGYGDVGYVWNLYTEGTGDGCEWDTKNPSTALNILTTDTVQDPSTALTIIDGGFIESSYTWNYNNPSTVLEVL